MTFTRNQLQERILNCTQTTFEEVALDVFQYQITHNLLYADFVNYLKKKPSQISKLTDIPFMPVGFFKNHKIISGSLSTPIVFESSGTTGAVTSRHYVADTAWYKRVSTDIFEQNYGSLQNTEILALLPSYLERNNSSLVYMVQQFIDKTNSKTSNFFLNDKDGLLEAISQAISNRQSVAGKQQSAISQKSKIKNPQLLAPPSGAGGATILWGVAFALLDLAENPAYGILKEIPNLIVMETGGMKGRRPEMLREELHQKLCQAFGVQTIHSEYGMTELLSQTYSKGDGIFKESKTMRILLRDINDPLTVYDFETAPRYGGINVIDLANLDSCAFIETQDLGRFRSKNSFEIIGRFDNSDIRGCNLMVM